LDGTLALIERAHQGDKEARDALFRQNTGLVHSVVRRYLGRGVDAEDLFQIGCIGLLKALDRFDPAFDVQLSSYAVPMITGEIRRYFRDDGLLKVSRSIKENQYKLYQKQQELTDSLGREPTFAELGEALSMPPEELVLVMESQSEVESLYKTIYQGEGTEIELMDKLPDQENPQELLLNRLFLEELLGRLPPRERQLIHMRYYLNMTQTDIAKKLGISQVQVSRMEKKILKRLRE
jgi:RNA polymerase sporulation-specific sigma factor